ncbi:MAG: hypothetical protein SFU27_04400 [Thermonemataceae bacterium]|nr:hypothetical protein [Thermonemataceae bacterium]
MELQQIIEKNKHLFWYFDKKKLDKITKPILIEFILNYGDMTALRELLETLGKEEVAREFAKAIKNDRHNYFPQVKNFFHLYFQRYVPQYPF